MERRMEFGMNSFKPLLSIAIPTWNRAAILKIALSRLLPQISHYNELIEIVISDNGSTDTTQEVISGGFASYENINKTLFKQEVNKGFYGNFKKLISLCRGKYIWILSDDDYTFEDVLPMIIKYLQDYNHNLGALFLSDWTSDSSEIETLSFQAYDQIGFFRQGNFRHTLISSIIFLNNISENDEIFKVLDQNALIAYPVFIKAVADSKEFGVIYGNSLITAKDDNVRFNALSIFTNDLEKCLIYLKNYLPSSILAFIANSFLSTLIEKHYRDFKYEGLYKDNPESFFKRFAFYLKFKNFYKHIIPIKLLPSGIYWPIRRVLKYLTKK